MHCLRSAHFGFPMLFFLLAIAGCYEVVGPDEPAMSQSRQESTNTASPFSRASLLGIEELYYGSLDDGSIERIENPEMMGSIIATLSPRAVDRLLDDGFLPIEGSQLVRGVAGGECGAHKLGRGKGFLLANVPVTWGCLKSCYSDHPLCGPCPQCCAPDHPPKRGEAPADYTEGF